MICISNFKSKKKDTRDLQTETPTYKNARTHLKLNLKTNILKNIFLKYILKIKQSLKKVHIPPVLLFLHETYCTSKQGRINEQQMPLADAARLIQGWLTSKHSKTRNLTIKQGTCGRTDPLIEMLVASKNMASPIYFQMHFYWGFSYSGCQ